MRRKLLLKGASQVATPMGQGPIAGPDMGNIAVLEHGAIWVEDGKISDVGDSDEMSERYARFADDLVDVNGRAVIPGFVDAHTHAVFTGDRAHEFEWRLSGRSYTEILADGGGILYTVERTRQADEARLLDDLMERLDAMLVLGTTTAEVKTGYGLETVTELR